MAEKYMFFDSTVEDEREYSADEFAEYFRQVISTGILNGGANLQVICDGSNMDISISLGYAWLEGYLYKIDIEPLSITVDTADPALNRIDRIIIQLDKQLENRYIRAFVLKGTPAATPTPPDLTRDENVFEISLAQILVIAGKSFIEQSEVTDERLDNSVCGLANSLVTADTTDIFNQFQAWYNSRTTEFQQQWDNWWTLHPGQYEIDWQNWLNQQQENWSSWFNTVQSGTYVTEEELTEKLRVAKSNFNPDLEVYEAMERYRSDGTLYCRTTTDTKDDQNRNTKLTVIYYQLDGITPLREEVYTLLYDEDVFIPREVVPDA